MMHVNCSYTMSDHDLVSYIIEENKRRKKRRIVLTELYFESVLLGVAYLSEQRRPREPYVYNAAIKNVRDKCNVEITKDNITSRCKTFDKHYEIISKILSQSGFGWDWDNNKLSMDSDDVWNRYVEVSTCTSKP